jgi:16S rRNA processing protein RimM
METIPKENCVKVGFIRKTHGVRGELILESERNFRDSISRAERFFVEISGLLVPFFISGEGLRFSTDNTAIVSFEWIENERVAHRLNGKSVYLFKNEITEEPSGELMYILPGYMLVDENSGEAGIISRVDDFSDNIVLSVIRGEHEILVPFNEDIMISVDHKKKILILNLPEGILK